MNSTRTCVRNVAAAAATLLLWTSSASAQNAQVTINLSNSANREVWRGETAGSKAGTSLDRGEVGAGDTRRDLIVGAPGWNTNTGRVYVHFAGPVLGGEVSFAQASVILTGAASGDLFGSATAAGYITAIENSSPAPTRDLVVGAPGANAGSGAVYVFNRGLAAGSIAASAANLIISGAPAGAQLGASLATGDLDGDGHREIIIGAPGTGAVYVVKGGAALPATINLSAPSSAFFRIQGSAADGVGRTVAAGDLSGHRAADSTKVTYDVVIGAQTEGGKGAVYLIKGRASNSFAAVMNLPADADARFEGIDAGDTAGAALTVAFLDTDNIQDLIIGAPNGDGPSNLRSDAGDVYVLWGSSTLASKSLSAADLTIYGAASGHKLGTKAAFGNIDRSGQEDIVLLAPGASAAGEIHAIVGRNRTGFGSVYDLSVRSIDRRLIGDPASGPIEAVVVFAHNGGNWEDIAAGVPSTNQGLVYISFSPELSDTNEPNDSTSGSIPVKPSAGPTSYIFSSSDVDFYQFQLGRDTHLRLELDVPADADYVLELLNVSGTVIKTSDTVGNGAGESITTTVPAQTYFVRVSGRSGSYSQASAYALRILMGPFTDAFEPNNGPNTAVHVGTMPLQAKVYTTEDADWYRFRVTGTGTVTVNLTVPAGADLDLSVQMASGTPMGTSNNSGNGVAESLSLSLAAGEYRVRVGAQGAASSTQNYTLSLTGGTVQAPTRSTLMLALGPLTGNGGWFNARGAADNAFASTAWGQLPWSGYNATGGGLRMAAGDVDADGLDEFVVSLGTGGDGYVAVLDDATTGYALMTWLRVPWAAYIASNGGETFPAVGDIDGDGYAEIVLGLGTGGQGWWMVFDDAARNFQFLTWKQVNWAAYNTGGQGAVHPAVGDVDGDGVAEIVLGLGTGSQGWIQVVNNAANGYTHRRWVQIAWPTYNNANGTVYPAVGDLDGDGRGEIVAGLGTGSEGWFAILNDASTDFAHIKWQQVPWPNYNAANGSVYPSVGNLDGDPAAEIAFGFAAFGTDGPWVQVLDDANTGYAHLRWVNVGFGRAIFPAIAAMR